MKTIFKYHNLAARPALAVLGTLHAVSSWKSPKYYFCLSDSSKHSCPKYFSSTVEQIALIHNAATFLTDLLETLIFSNLTPLFVIVACWY